ncbi:hypothetical protein ACFFHM_17405 [Halalkalibacter kiskunsagensis]|uniref:Uncharacterized protein n=1 Tax=Halalkalibacter kiskunsagensis TaxID=1548599 RepID=A0ABV6KFX7_9BACI
MIKEEIKKVVQGSTGTVLMLPSTFVRRNIGCLFSSVRLTFL